MSGRRRHFTTSVSIFHVMLKSLFNRRIFFGLCVLQIEARQSWVGDPFQSNLESNHSSPEVVIMVDMPP